MFLADFEQRLDKRSDGYTWVDRRSMDLKGEARHAGGARCSGLLAP